MVGTARYSGCSFQLSTVFELGLNQIPSRCETETGGSSRQLSRPKLLIRPHEVLMSVRLELVERLLVLRQAQHERLKHLRAGSISPIDLEHSPLVTDDNSVL